MKVSGKKTYLAAAGMILYAAAGLLLGQIEPAEAWPLILQAAAIFGLRHGMKRGG